MLRNVLVSAKEISNQCLFLRQLGKRRIQLLLNCQPDSVRNITRVENEASFELFYHYNAFFCKSYRIVVDFFIFTVIVYFNIRIRLTEINGVKKIHINTDKKQCFVGNHKPFLIGKSTKLKALKGAAWRYYCLYLWLILETLQLNTEDCILFL